MKSIALTVWSNRISPVFETTSQLLIVEISKGSIQRRFNYIFTSDLQLDRVCQLFEFNVNELLCGAVSNIYSNMIQAYGIKLFPFLTGPVEEVLNAYFSNTLFSPQYAMPGCRRKRYRRGRHSKK